MLEQQLRQAERAERTHKKTASMEEEAANDTRKRLAEAEENARMVNIMEQKQAQQQVLRSEMCCAMKKYTTWMTSRYQFDYSALPCLCVLSLGTFFRKGHKQFFVLVAKFCRRSYRHSWNARSTFSHSLSLLL